MHPVLLAVMSGALAVGSLNTYEREVVIKRMRPRSGRPCGRMDLQLHGLAAYIPTRSQRAKFKRAAAHRARTVRR